MTRASPSRARLHRATRRASRRAPRPGRSAPRRRPRDRRASAITNGASNGWPISTISPAAGWNSPTARRTSVGVRRIVGAATPARAAARATNAAGRERLGRRRVPGAAPGALGAAQPDQRARRSPAHVGDAVRAHPDRRTSRSACRRAALATPGRRAPRLRTPGPKKSDARPATARTSPGGMRRRTAVRVISARVRPLRVVAVERQVLGQIAGDAVAVEVLRRDENRPGPRRALQDVLLQPRELLGPAVVGRRGALIDRRPRPAQAAIAAASVHRVGGEALGAGEDRSRAARDQADAAAFG